MASLPILFFNAATEACAWVDTLTQTLLENGKKPFEWCNLHSSPKIPPKSSVFIVALAREDAIWGKTLTLAKFGEDRLSKDTVSHRNRGSLPKMPNG